jgi:hypothetical protein
MHVLDATGGDPLTAAFNQSETALAISPDPNAGMIVTYNDKTSTDTTVIYPVDSGTAEYHRGASLMGWSWSNDLGQTWTHNKLPTPADWPLLWGDPAATASLRHPGIMYIANLASPLLKFNSAAGVGDYVTEPEDALAGACVFKSTNHGQAFSLLFCDCENYDFWDGEHMAPDLDADGGAFLASNNRKLATISIFHILSDDGPAHELLHPFPGQQFLNHPRVRSDPETNALYVIAQAVTGKLMITKWSGGAWGPVVDTGAVPAAQESLVQLSDRTIKLGPEYAFDIGSNQLASDAIRILYTRRDTILNRNVIDSVICSRDLACQTGPWNTVSFASDQFQPVLRAPPGSVGGNWLGGYYSRAGDPAGNQVSVIGAELGPNVLLQNEMHGLMTPCSTLDGYWGDYNDMQYAYDAQTNYFQWIQAYSVSNSPCTTRTSFVGMPTHVGVTVGVTVLMDQGTALHPATN